MDRDDLEEYEDGDDGIVYRSSADIDGTDEDAVVRTVRRIRVEFSGFIEVEVIEPPQVFEAEIKQSVKRRIIEAFRGHTLGVPVGYDLKVTN